MSREGPETKGRTGSQAVPGAAQPGVRSAPASPVSDAHAVAAGLGSGGRGALLDVARVERAAWVLAVLAPASAEALLEGLSPPLHATARAALRGLGALDSGRRQVQLAHAFGERPDAERRLHALAEAVPGALRARLARLAPPYLRAALAERAGADTARVTGTREGSAPCRERGRAPAAGTEPGAGPATRSGRDTGQSSRPEGTPIPGPAPHPPADALAARLLREAVR